MIKCLYTLPPFTMFLFLMLHRCMGHQFEQIMSQSHLIAILRGNWEELTPEFGFFLENLQNTIGDELRKFLRWRETGRTGKTPSNKTWDQADAEIARCQHELMTGRYGVEDFLRAVTNRYQRMDMQFAVRRFRAAREREHILPAPEEMLKPQNIFPDDPAREVLPLRRRRGPRVRRDDVLGNRGNLSESEMSDIDDEAQQNQHLRDPVGANDVVDGGARDNAPKCVVCMMADIRHILIPCYHYCCCENCASTLATMVPLERRKCPKCRAEIAEYLLVYIESA